MGLDNGNVVVVMVKGLVYKKVGFGFRLVWLLG